VSISRLSFGGGIIFCFHEIELKKFVSIIKFFKKFYSLISLDDFINCLNTNKSVSGKFAITFDDGWNETCINVAAYSKDNKWPITLYIPTQILDDRGSLWFGYINKLINLKNKESKPFKFMGIDLNFQSKNASKESVEKLVVRFKKMPGEHAYDEMKDLLEKLDLKPSVNEQFPFINIDFIKKYSDCKYITFGSHTVDHRALNVQSEKELIWNLSKSKKILHDITQKDIDHFCYPYGGENDISNLSREITSKYYKSGTTMLRGKCDKKSDPYYLPRISIYQKDSIPRIFAKILSSTMQ